MVAISERPPAGPPDPERLTPERVFTEYGPRVYNLARRILANDADAEDVTQDVLLLVIRKLDTFRGDAAFTTWLHRVTVNAALANRRKAHNRQEKTIADPLDAFIDDGKHLVPIRAWADQPDEQILNRESSEIIEAAIADLPDLYRDVYVLADVEGLPNADIGELLGLNLPAVKSRLHRARLMMRAALAPHFEEAAP